MPFSKNSGEWLVGVSFNQGQTSFIIINFRVE